MDKPAIIALARQKAEKYGLDGDLVCAIVEQESNPPWDTWSTRYEPAFYAKYVQPMPHLGATEANARATSWGLLQVMGQVAREYGFGGPHLSELCDPEIGLEMGCKYFSALMGKAGNNVNDALLRWNGGGNPKYPSEVMARIATYNA